MSGYVLAQLFGFKGDEVTVGAVWRSIGPSCFVTRTFLQRAAIAMFTA
jgi:hypothetical protein